MDKIKSDPTFKGAIGQPLTHIMYFNQLGSTKTRFKVCKEVLMTLGSVIYTQKNFYLLDEFNAKIEIFRAAGLIDFWQFQKLDKKLLSFKEMNQPKVLNIYQLMGTFQILLLGSIISFIVFLVEIFYMCRNNFVTFRT